MNFQTTADRIRSNAPTSSLMAKLPDHFEALIHKDIKPIGWKQTEDQIQAIRAMQARDDALKEANEKRAAEKEQRLIEYKKHQILKRLEHRKQVTAAKQEESHVIPETEDGRERSYLASPYRCTRLIWIVADIMGFTVEDIMGKRKPIPLAHARHVLCWILKKELGMSLPAIGRAIGGRDHTTILHAVRKINDSDKLRKEANITRNEVLFHEFERYGLE